MTLIKTTIRAAFSRLQQLLWNIKNFLIRKWNEQEEDSYFI